MCKNKIRHIRLFVNRDNALILNAVQIIIHVQRRHRNALYLTHVYRNTAKRDVAKIIKYVVKNNIVRKLNKLLIL